MSEHLPSSTRTDSRRPTLKTIAELSGFAVQTVSRALGDAPDISAKTKATVRKIADDIGYVPNRAGVRLRTGRTNVISLVLSTDHDVLNLSARLISSVAEGMRETGYHLVVTPSFPDDDPLKPVLYIVQNRTADAIILNQTLPEDPRVAYLMERNFPFVTHGRTIWADQHSYFDYDNHAFGRRSIKTLAARGRKCVLLLAPPQNQNYAIEMIDGARAEAAQHGVTLLLSDGADSDSNRHLVRDYIAGMVKAHPEIDAIISASPNATMAAISGIEQSGLTLGPDFDVFSKEAVPILDLFRPGVLTEKEDVTRAGQFLSRAAVQVAKGDNVAPLQQLDGPDMTGRSET